MAAIHYHAWLRSGRSFLLAPRRFDERRTATYWATQQRPSKGDRLVLVCESCPKPVRTRGPSVRAVVAAVADATGVDVAVVGRVLAAATAARGRLKAETRKGAAA